MPGSRTERRGGSATRCRAPRWGAALALLAAVGAGTEPLVEPATGLSFEATRTVDGVTYTCLGVGVRKLLIFRVYALAFCLEADRARAVVARAKRAGRGGAYLAGLAGSDAEKLVVMRMVRSVGVDTMADAFRDSLAGILPPDKIERLAATIPGDARAGETVLLSSRDGALRFDFEGVRDRVEDAEIARELWRVWLEPDGIAPSLREDLVRRADLSGD